MKKIMAALVLLAVSQARMAEGPLTGNMLHELCNDEDDVKAGVCAGYVIGWDEGYLAGWIGGKYFQIPVICMPDDVTSTQKVDVVKKYLDQNPEKRHEIASVIVFDAFAEAWPCKSR